MNGDHQGSLVALADCAGNRVAVNSYDEYGIPAGSNIGRFQYTGQAWLPEIGLYYYKARIYSPTLGRFLQTDPIGYEDQMNLYAYVGNDPVNGIDPTGTRFITANERAMLMTAFGSIMDPNNRSSVSNPNKMQIFGVDSQSRAIAYNHSVVVPRNQFSDDYSKEQSFALRRLFWHEFYHIFEYKTGTSSFAGLAWNQISSGFSSSLYTYDDNKSFNQNNPEARAGEFGNCMAGGSCSRLEGMSIGGNGTSLSFKGGVFTLREERPGSRIPHLTRFKPEDLQPKKEK